MSCSTCGDGPPNDGLRHGPTNNNPLDCNTRFINCENPCSVRAGANTPQCESLPSQIQNFTLQFFGTVVKTEVNGQVVWSLPCSLDVGLPNNPRALDEGLACYFLRLFHEGIVGLTGPQGEDGTPGVNGNNAYSVTLKAFTQPTGASPVLQVVTAANPAILNGTYVFIDTSGWYQVLENTDGVLLLSLVRSLSSAPATIAAGKLVVPSGFPGAQGNPGPAIAGPKGDKGDPGQSFTATNHFFFADAGSDSVVGLTYSAVNFTATAPNVLLVAAGTYLLTAVIDIVGTAGVAVTDIASAKLVNTSISADVPGSEHSVSVETNGARSQIIISAIYATDSANQTVAIYAKATSAAVMNVKALNTTLSYVRLQ